MVRDDHVEILMGRQCGTHLSEDDIHSDSGKLRIKKLSVTKDLRKAGAIECARARAIGAVQRKAKGGVKKVVFAQQNKQEKGMY